MVFPLLYLQTAGKFSELWKTLVCFEYYCFNTSRNDVMHGILPFMLEQSDIILLKWY
jgi:hypothetical protein